MISARSLVAVATVLRDRRRPRRRSEQIMRAGLLVALLFGSCAALALPGSRSFISQWRHSSEPQANLTGRWKVHRKAGQLRLELPLGLMGSLGSLSNGQASTSHMDAALPDKLATQNNAEAPDIFWGSATAAYQVQDSPASILQPILPTHPPAILSWTYPSCPCHLLALRRVASCGRGCAAYCSRYWCACRPYHM